ncbi:MAG: hypothetical protein LBU24_04715 [Methanocalculaceae archaeon]|nr:hypothetical protein [Methanocalculaceae archaeon]
MGRIKGKFSIVTYDDTLKGIWREDVQKQPAKFREEIIAFLRCQGYSILFYDRE